ncbi:3'-5' exonuclease [Cyanobacterium stanieri LEGE 03274]|uniref:3'-5' exonuclease n=1 Tax=Cyanobacterium stanieri LEGE 03274 TaxID=1828756 RepID=A0ABR9V0V5_9CHRO|nr:3'-5' exonuclease [Cyanobacterium stanieri]MBE9221515.1 3'-5' exonuclease [Cyanobacterium stanieri LEGE 03274]
MYLTDKEEIKDIILDLKDTDILWLDTETADYKSNNPRISLVQVLAYADNVDGSRTYLFDVLNQRDLVDYFIEHIMVNESITKVFHNARYDLRFLGEGNAKNVFCTYNLAKNIPYYLLPIKSKSLKALTEHFTDFKDIDKGEQGGDWGVRPLSKNQLYYAQMDCVYLAQVYHHLVILEEFMNKREEEKSLDFLCERYKEIEEEWLFLDSEIKDLKEQIKRKMINDGIKNNDYFKLSESKTNTIKTNLQELVKLVNEGEVNLNFSVTLTKDIQTILGDNLNDLSTEIITKSSYRLTESK